ncbi:hypothetical protein M2359_004596 [Gordonia amarae]|uniref:Uncharacterized protein n=1 Tax=Gordonia amarae NBRC 15530 TaxID=1075090 RepID=G7GWB0_9ACTN|nr:hypothetical protein [Gordonia amarae]GAB07885.1 hypothetical protein GOAMR_75_00450 [Gordonia amarae NBRC 15530]
MRRDSEWLERRGHHRINGVNYRSINRRAPNLPSPQQPPHHCRTCGEPIKPYAEHSIALTPDTTSTRATYHAHHTPNDENTTPAKNRREAWTKHHALNQRDKAIARIDKKIERSQRIQEQHRRGQ